MKNTKEFFSKLYNGSYYTIIGCGGDLNEWKNGYQELLDKEGIGTIKEWHTFKGKDFNANFNKKEFKQTVIFLSFPLDGLNIEKLAIFKLRMGDRWFDDIVNNAIENPEEFLDIGE